MSTNNLDENTCVDSEDLTMTTENLSLRSLELNSPERKPMTIESESQGQLLCEIKFKTPKGLIEVKVKEMDKLQQIADKVFDMGGFSDNELKQSILFYFSRMVAQAF